MDGTALDTSNLDHCQDYSELERIFEKHGVAWLLDLTDPLQCDRLVQDAAAICGLKPDELRAELSQAMQMPPPQMVRRIPR